MKVILGQVLTTLITDIPSSIKMGKKNRRVPTPPTFREPYNARAIRFLELWEPQDWRIKVYGIAYQGELPRTELILPAKSAASDVLRNIAPSHTTFGVGFLGIHDGRGENQIFVDVWANENELLHTVFVSPTDEPAAVRPAPAGHNSVCVWDLHLQCFERRAWLETVMRNEGEPDLEAYLAQRCNEDV